MAGLPANTSACAYSSRGTYLNTIRPPSSPHHLMYRASPPSPVACPLALALWEIGQRLSPRRRWLGDRVCTRHTGRHRRLCRAQRPQRRRAYTRYQTCVMCAFISEYILPFYCLSAAALKAHICRFHRLVCTCAHGDRSYGGGVQRRLATHRPAYIDRSTSPALQPRSSPINPEL